jgi:hypothetical protein
VPLAFVYKSVYDLNKIEIDAVNGGLNMFGANTTEPGATSEKTLELTWGLPDNSPGTCGEITIYTASAPTVNTFLNSERIEINDDHSNFGSKVTFEQGGIRFRKWNPVDDNSYYCSWDDLIKVVNRLA